MNSTFKPLLIVGVALVVAIGGIITYNVIQNKDDNSSSMQKSSENKDQTAATTDAKATNMVTIKSYAFSPATIKVKVGTKVTWTNQDSVEHTVTSDEGSTIAIESGLFKKGESFSYTFDKVGTYDYHCLPHPYMKGTVIVTE